MAYEIVMPQLGLSMDSGKISRWLKQSGQAVAPGEVLLEVESDKATIEVEAVTGGQLHIRPDTAGAEVKVGTVIGYILAPGERVPGGQRIQSGPATVVSTPAAGVATTPETAAAAGHAPGGTAPRRPRSSPAARRRATELGVDWRAAAGTGPGGRIKERDVLRLAEAQRLAQKPLAPQAEPATELPPRVSPLAQQLAGQFGLDLALVAERFPNRRIEREQVEETIREIIRGARVRGPAAPATPAPHSGPAFAAGRREARRQPMGAVRRLIADHMAASAQANAAVTLTTEVDATELVRLREALRGPDGRKTPPSYNVLLAKIVACALPEHPELNASIEGQEIVYWDTVNVGVAVDTPKGLVVPVLFDAGRKSLEQLAGEAEELLPRAAAGKALPTELTGGTFTLTNLGTYQIDAFTPIINAPECAILGIGRLKRRPVVDDAGAVQVRTLLYLSLTFDHRLVDGAPAARFLQRVSQYVEQPYLWLAGL